MTGIYLTPDDLMRAGAMDWDAALEDIRAAIALLRAGEAEMVAESVLPLGQDPRAKAYGLPARVGGAYAAAGIKWTVHRPEAPLGGEAITSRTVLDDLRTGLPMGIADSAMLTRVRTAAVSGSVMRALRPELRRVAILGTGAQARMHLAMCLAVFPDLRELHLWSRSGTVLTDVAGKTLPDTMQVVQHTSAGDAARAAQVVLACTSAPQPVLFDDAIFPGQLVLQIGFHEVSFDAIEVFDHVTCDLWGTFAQTSAKSLFQMYRAGRFAPGQVAADLPAILLDGWQPEADAAVYFSSFGLNIFDIAIAARLMRQAQDMGLGLRL